MFLPNIFLMAIKKETPDFFGSFFGDLHFLLKAC